ncbi:MAG: hypothetical protein HKL96_03605 [Phycisphaerales bacterium]|nr:hypothetical protein [Phycisphaerales bacterium]
MNNQSELTSGSPPPRLAHWFVPASVVLGMLVLPGLITLILLHGQIASTATAPLALTSWLMLILLLTTWTAVLVTLNARPGNLADLSLSTMLLLAAIILLLLALRWAAWHNSGHGYRAVAAVLLSWALLCEGVVAGWLAVFPRFGIWIGLAAFIVMTMLLGAPMTLEPIFAFPGSTHPMVAQLLINTCPTLWLLGAAQSLTHFTWFDWFHSRLLYQWNVLGQNIPMPKLLPWLACCATAAALGVACAITGFVSQIRTASSNDQ